MTPRTPADPLATFHPAVRAWFSERFGQPSPPQALGWPLIAAGRNCLITAPTGSGKTLAAFLKCLDALWQGANPDPAGVQVLYVSPLKALNADIERNLREPLAGVLATAAAMGQPLPALFTAVRTGDTDPRERAAMLRRPPHVLITTPESLYLILTSSRARAMLRTVRYVVVDEIHAVLGTKRGVHLAVSLERLEAICHRPPVRVGLTATVRPLERAARFLGGQGRDGRPRPVTVADAGLRKGLDLLVEVPVAGMGNLPDDSIWPAVHQRLLELIRSHRSTLIFVNNRGLAERLAARLNDLAGHLLVRTHHGSMSRETRQAVEEELKAGRLPALVATATLELGIDVGAIDLVVQVESPKGVARGLQRVGRAGHLLGAASKGRIVPKFRADLLEAAAIARGMLRGQVEETRVPENCLDVLAQQVAAMAAVDEWQDSAMLDLVRGAYPYRDLVRRQFEGVLHMLAGRYSAAEFHGLRPRITWDRVHGTVRAREGTGALAIRSGGTIPDRGLFSVVLRGAGIKLGEIDEEFGYETRPGELFLFGTAVWRTERVTHDSVEVSPAQPQPWVRQPFWRGDYMGRPAAVGRAVGALARQAGGRLDDPALPDWLQAECALDAPAAANLRSYLWDLQEHLGTVPHDRQLVCEWFPDELGGCRVILLSPYGGPVNAAWALALRRAYRQLLATEVETVYNDEGILLRLPPLEGPPPLDLLAELAPGQAEALVVDELANSPLLGAYFRMAAERALLLPRHGLRKRTPLWLQRQKAKDLFQAVQPHADFPILLEAYRECLQDVLDVPALKEVLRGLQTGEISLAVRPTGGPSPAAAGLVFNFTNTFLYQDDTPRAERAAAALSLERNLLLELLGAGRLRELLDPRAVQAVHAQLQRTAPERRARSAGELHDLLLEQGDLPVPEAAERCDGPAEAWLAELEATGRAVALPVGGRAHWVAAEAAETYAGALAGDAGARAEVLRRFARSRGPFTLAAAANRYGWDPARVRDQLAVLAAGGLLVEGSFTRGVDEPEWCDLAVLERLRTRTLALLRREVEPRAPADYARFLWRWQGCEGKRTGLPALRGALRQLQGLWLPAAAWEREVLPRRVAGYQGAWLDQLLAAGEFLWAGSGDRLAFFAADQAPWLAPDPPAAAPALSPAAQATLAALQQRGAAFLGALALAAGLTPPECLGALWELVRAGLAANDTFAPVRERLRGPVRAREVRRGMGARRQRAALGAGVAGGTGRWSLLPRAGAGPAPDPEARDLGWASLLLERYGVVAREMAAAEGAAPPWGRLYPVLRRLELQGRVRRGYFVSGLGGAQFALPDAVERLRAGAGPGAGAPAGGDGPAADLVPAADPANPWGAILPLPQAAEGRLRLARIPGAYLVTRAGAPLLAVEGYGRRLVPLAPLGAADLPGALGALCRLLEPVGRERPVRRIEVEWWADRPAAESPAAAPLLAAGFQRNYRRLTLWPR